MVSPLSTAQAIGELIDGLLARRPPVDDREAVSVLRFRSELAGRIEPCSETADTTHVTASAIVVGLRGVVLHKHKRLGIWLQPGGHIDEGETPGDAALRECFEETGLRAEHFSGRPELVHLDTHDGPRGHYHLDLRFLLSVPDDDPNPPEGESPEARWWSLEELRTHREPGISGIIDALRTFTLRSAEPRDACAAAEVYLRSFTYAYRNGLVRMAHSPDQVRTWIREELFTSSKVMVATAAGTVVGYIATKPGWIEHLYVDPAFMSQGIGSALLISAQRDQPGEINLWTFQENLRAQSFYQRHGFVATERTAASNEEGQPDVRMSFKDRHPTHTSSSTAI
jgi:8-oxo-dGTP pyrophosphatase MutT (NUDIX family)/N-acetylglutamate synthase-like GNAT family acetyltransferase